MDSITLKLLGLHVAKSNYQEELATTNMSQLLKRQIWYLYLLSTAPPAQWKALLDTITNDQLRALTEVTYNVLQGNIILTEAHKKRLRQHKLFLRVLADQKESLIKKREALCRKETVVTLLIKAAAPQLKKLL